MPSGNLFNKYNKYVVLVVMSLLIAVVLEIFTFNYSAAELTVRDSTELLNGRLYHLLKYLCEHEGQVLSKEQIYERVWGDTYFDDNTVMVHIRHIREKIEIDSKKPRYVKVVWGIGYKMELKK